MMDKKNLVKKLYYRSLNRGCKESDYLFTEFANKYLSKLDDDKIILYSELLEESDIDIMNWVMNIEEVPKKYEEIVKLFRKK